MAHYRSMKMYRACTGQLPIGWRCIDFASIIKRDFCASPRVVTLIPREPGKLDRVKTSSLPAQEKDPSPNEVVVSLTTEFNSLVGEVFPGNLRIPSVAFVYLNTELTKTTNFPNCSCDVFQNLNMKNLLEPPMYY